MKLLINFFFFSLPLFYAFAGVYHFINPEFYLPVMPSYVIFPLFVNYVVGFIEIALAIAFIFPVTRRLACLGIILLLFQFVPVHIDFIVKGSCIEEMLCVPEWMGYARLLVIHPILIFWAWYFRNDTRFVLFKPQNT